jgi:hypothetical protein
MAFALQQAVLGIHGDSCVRDCSDRSGPGKPELDPLSYPIEIVAKSTIEGHRGRILSGPVPPLVDFGQQREAFFFGLGGQTVGSNGV